MSHKNMSSRQKKYKLNKRKRLPFGGAKKINK